MRPAAALLGLLSATVAAVAAPSPAPSRPSILLVTLDTTRADHVGAYGAALAATPNLDALARSGVRFDRASASAPLTLPSHATILTGRVPRRHGVRDNAGFRLDPGVPVVTERLAAAGYQTAAYVSSAVLDRDGGLARGFSVYDDAVRAGDAREFGRVERAASRTTDLALEGLSKLKPPFFLWVHYFDPHLPYVPPEPFRTRFKDRPYDGEIAFMDAQVGRLLERVRARAGGSLIVAAAGDHGESLGEHGEAAHGVFVYEATQHVPLIVAGPGLPAGRGVAASVGLVDLAPTLLELVGLPALDGADGRSLVPVARGGRAAPRDYEMETFFPRFAYGWSPLRALVSGPAKYVAAPRPELYRLDRDPGERRDVSSERSAEAKALAAKLAERTSGDDPAPALEAPGLSQRREELAALGYVGGSGTAPTGPPIDPKDGVSWLADLEAGRRALQLGDPRDGIAPLERLLARNPGNVPALLVLGQCRLASGDTARAEEVFRRALALDGRNHLAWFHLGNALAGRAPDRAREAYETALSLAPRHAETYVNALGLLVAKRAFPEADALYLRALKAGVEDPDVELHGAVAALARGDAAAGRARLERALALDPTNARAREALARLAAHGR